MPSPDQDFISTVASSISSGNLYAPLFLIIIYRSFSLLNTFVRRSNCYRRKRRNRRPKSESDSD